MMKMKDFGSKINLNPHPSMKKMKERT